MPIRKTRARKNDGLRRFIPMLYERPALKFLKCGEPWEDLADVMFGPPTSRPSVNEIEKLRQVWSELRDDILTAQKTYAPDKEAWGARQFDRGRRTKE